MVSHSKSVIRELLVLHLLGSEKIGLYGLDLVARSQGHLKRGGVYVTLGRLQEKGHVLSKKAPARVVLARLGIPGRTMYEITQAGKLRLVEAQKDGWHPPSGRGGSVITRLVGVVLKRLRDMRGGTPREAASVIRS